MKQHILIKNADSPYQYLTALFTLNMTR